MSTCGEFGGLPAVKPANGAHHSHRREACLFLIAQGPRRQAALIQGPFPSPVLTASLSGSLGSRRLCGGFCFRTGRHTSSSLLRSASPGMSSQTEHGQPGSLGSPGPCANQQKESLMGRKTHHVINTLFSLPAGVVTRTLLCQSIYKDNGDRHGQLGCEAGREVVRAKFRDEPAKKQALSSVPG